MINQEVIEAYNSRLTIDTSKISELSASQRDAVKAYGAQAQALLRNRDLAQFVHHYRFGLADTLAELNSHTPDSNAERVAIANQMSGLTGLINSLKRAVYVSNRVVAWEQQPPPTKPDHIKQVFDPDQ